MPISLITVMYPRIFFDPSAGTDGYYWNYNNGQLLANASYIASDYISCKGSTKYTRTNQAQIAWFTAAKTYISGVGTGEAYTVTSPATAAYMGVACLTSVINTYQIVEGEFMPEYTPFGAKYIDRLQFAPNAGIARSIQSVMSRIVLKNASKKIKLIGDSITHGEGGTGFAQDGDLIMTQGITTWNVNTSGTCWANSLKAYFESKLGITVLNYGTTGANSLTIVNGLSQLIDGTEDIVICMIGTNDRSNNTMAQFYANLQTIYNYCNNLGIDIIFMSSIPASVTQDAGETKHMEDIDHVVMKVSAYYQQEYISVYKRFIEHCRNTGVTIDSLLTVGGLHPTDAGYVVMFEIICNALGIATKRDGATW